MYCTIHVSFEHKSMYDGAPSLGEPLGKYATSTRVHELFDFPVKKLRFSSFKSMKESDETHGENNKNIKIISFIF
jgi:hypothetical protein